MLYREAGQFKSTYAEDQQIFPIRQDRIAVAALLVFAFVVVPLIANQYWFAAILTPLLIFALATLGLNILTGYAGQLSLGTAAFMAIGAFMAYNFELRVPGMPILVSFALGGLCAAAVGIVFGLPSLRIKGFYLAVATLACQFFVLWALQRFGWFSNNSTSGVITAGRIEILGYTFQSAGSKYLLTLGVVSVMALLAKNLMRSETGRAFMAVRDMDVAASVIGIPIMRPSCWRSRSARSTAASPARSMPSATSAPSSRRRSTWIFRSGSCSWSSSAAWARSSARFSAPPSSRCCRSS